MEHIKFVTVYVCKNWWLIIEIKIIGQNPNVDRKWRWSVVMNLSHRVGSRFHTASLEASSSANNPFAEGSGEMSPGPSIPLRRAALFLAAISISCFVLYRAADSLSFSPPIFDLSSYLVSLLFSSPQVLREFDARRY